MPHYLCTTIGVFSIASAVGTFVIHTEDVSTGSK
jgi:hypothetical protein